MIFFLLFQNIVHWENPMKNKLQIPIKVPMKIISLVRKYQWWENNKKFKEQISINQNKLLGIWKINKYLELVIRISTGLKEFTMIFDKINKKNKKRFKRRKVL